MIRLVWYAPGWICVVENFADWQALPDGIEGVVEYEPDGGRVLVSGGDWYTWDAGRIRTSAVNFERGVWSDPPQETCSSCVKRSGPWLEDDQWERIYAEMWDRRWP